MAEYFLPGHVYFCCRGDDCVFLDLRQDDYILLNGAAAAALRTFCRTQCTHDLRLESAAALQELLEGGLLTTDRSTGKIVRATQTELALEPLIDHEDTPQIRLRALHVYRFIAACVTAAACLRWKHIEDIVKTVEQRKHRHVTTESFDMGRARELTAVFQKLRALFPRNHLCFYDSLALLEFLARYRLFPTWVFGVKLEPWAAHCWVQEKQFAFNEGVEEAAGYTPIMAI